ncbi:hypothetical protein HL653_05600 [Sphingomonas sp. AP4-R1]|uniref:hypothetical protein n=1 Tax=Sphingomonas sp. AP4-R1 TaxID=2735134 RepID=UPI001493CF80|nr:hypothetical protein [Sphingomonas sp. AP4-R1]QJU57331.1 hypothetical protein HL653_05600 [Sphingomonas sp. AP4-R1]
MRSGYWVVAVFATGWASAGLIAVGYSPLTCLLPALISGAILLCAYSLPSTGGQLGSHTRKVLARWSLLEGLAIVLAVNLLHQTHHPDATFPIVAAIVGFHFLPLARGIPVRLYYLTAAGLVLIGATGMLVPTGERPFFVGLGAAAVLWATAVYRLTEARRLVAA